MFDGVGTEEGAAGDGQFDAALPVLNRRVEQRLGAAPVRMIRFPHNCHAHDPLRKNV